MAVHTEAAREESHLLTVHEVATMLQVPVSWIYGRMRKRSTERLPGYRPGKYWRFRQAEVLARVESQRRDFQVVCSQLNGQYVVRNPKLFKLWESTQPVIRRKKLAVTFVWVPRAGHLAGELI